MRLILRLSARHNHLGQYLPPKSVKHFLDYDMKTMDTTYGDLNNNSNNDIINTFDIISNNPSRCSNWLRWRPTSAQELDRAENKVLSFLKNPFRSYHVDIGRVGGLDNNKIWTLEMTPKVQPLRRGQNANQMAANTAANAPPLVMIHGFASAVGLWTLNLDSLLETNRKIYAFDILGFGKSSRPVLSAGDACELDLVDSIERWRSRVGLDQKFVLLGHSFGAYLAAAYALQHPERVSHLILADPWGMPSQQMNQTLNQHRIQLPMWARMVSKIVQLFTPLAGLRAAGPWGPGLVQKLRPDIKRKFEQMAGEGNAECFLEYIYHCNAQPVPSGEMAFKSMATGFGWAKNPMLDRMPELHPAINVTFIYGSKSWVDRQPGFQTKYILGDRVNVEVIQGSGHHVYADDAEEFNRLVADVCHAEDRRLNAPAVDSDESDEERVQTLTD